MQGSGSSRTPALEVRDLSRIYGTGDIAVRALRGVSFHVASGDMVCIMGKSGSGKSTLLRQLGLLDAPSSGQVLLDGVDVTRLRESHRRVLRLEHLGYVFQEYALLPELTAEENVYLPSLMSALPCDRLGCKPGNCSRCLISRIAPAIDRRNSRADSNSVLRLPAR